MRKAAELARNKEWMKYVIAAVLIHGAVLSIPVAMRIPHNAGPIEVLVIGSANPPPTVGSMQGGGPKSIARRAGSPEVEHKQVLAQSKVPPAASLARREEPSPIQAIRTPGSELAALPAPATSQEAETGVAVGSVPGTTGLAGLGPASGTAGSGVGGGGTGSGGSGGGSGKGPGGGDGSVTGAGFGTPGGPRFLHKAVPEYPFLARRRKKEGSVVLMVTIDEAGKLIKTEVVEASDRIFVESSVDAVKNSTFLPAERNGHPVPCRALLPIRFCLTE